MRFTATSGAGGRRAGAICAAILLAVGVSATAVVSGAGGTPSAAAAKKKPKKCKKARWKCAPKVYYLEAAGSYATPVFRLDWTAAVLLRKRRAGPGLVDYSQWAGEDPEDCYCAGFVTMVGTGTGFDYDHCTTSGDDVMINIPYQKLKVPEVADPYLSDFALRFKLIGREKNTYGLGVGDVQPETSNIVGTVNVICDDGTSHNDEFPYTDSALAVRALVKRGKVGSHFLSGRRDTRFETARGTAHDFVEWELRAFCGLDLCSPLAR
jgi:hypothetical protein